MEPHRGKGTDMDVRNLGSSPGTTVQLWARYILVSQFIKIKGLNSVANTAG